MLDLDKALAWSCGFAWGTGFTAVTVVICWAVWG